MCTDSYNNYFPYNLSDSYKVLHWLVFVNSTYWRTKLKYNFLFFFSISLKRSSMLLPSTSVS